MGCSISGKSAKELGSVYVPVMQDNTKSLLRKVLRDSWTGSAKVWSFIRTIKLLELLLFGVLNSIGKDFNLLFYSWENREETLFSDAESLILSSTQLLLVLIMEGFQS